MAASDAPRYTLRLWQGAEEVQALRLPNFSQIPQLLVTLHDARRTAVPLAQFRLTITSPTLQLQSVADSTLPLPWEAGWLVPAMYLRAEAEGPHSVVFAATRLGGTEVEVQPTVLTVEVRQNNHPCKVHLTSPNLAHVTVGSAILPVVRIVGDAGHFWGDCPRGALTCQLVIPPTDPPIRLPLFVGTAVQGRGTFTDDNAFEFTAMATFPFRLTGAYELVFRLDLRQLPYSCMLSPAEQWLQQRYAFSLAPSKVFGLLLEKSVPNVILSRPRVSRADPHRLLCQELTVALVDHRKKVVTEASGVVRASVQRYHSAHAAQASLPAPSLDGPAEAEVVQGRATFAGLQMKEQGPGATGLYQLCLQYETLHPVRIKFEYFEEPRMLERFPARPAEPPKVVPVVPPVSQPARRAASQPPRKRSSKPVPSSAVPPRGGGTAARRSRSQEVRAASSPAPKTSDAPPRVSSPKGFGPNASTEAILNKLRDRRRQFESRPSPTPHADPPGRFPRGHPASRAAGHRSASLPLRSASPAPTPPHPPMGRRRASPAPEAPGAAAIRAARGRSAHAASPSQRAAALRGSSPVTLNPLASLAGSSGSPGGPGLGGLAQLVFPASNPYFCPSPPPDERPPPPRLREAVVALGAGPDPDRSLKPSISPIDLVSDLSADSLSASPPAPSPRPVARRLDFAALAPVAPPPMPPSMTPAAVSTLAQSSGVQPRIPSRSPSPSLVTGVDGSAASSHPLPLLQHCGLAPAPAPALPATGAGERDVPKSQALGHRPLRSSPVPDTTLLGPLTSDQSGAGTSGTPQPMPQTVTPTAPMPPPPQPPLSEADGDSEAAEVRRLNLPRLRPPPRGPSPLSSAPTDPTPAAPAPPTLPIALLGEVEAKMQQVQQWVGSVSTGLRGLEPAAPSLSSSPIQRQQRPVASAPNPRPDAAAGGLQESLSALSHGNPNVAVRGDRPPPGSSSSLEPDTLGLSDIRPDASSEQLLSELLHISAPELSRLGHALTLPPAAAALAAELLAHSASSSASAFASHTVGPSATTGLVEDASLLRRSPDGDRPRWAAGGGGAAEARPSVEQIAALLEVVRRLQHEKAALEADLHGVRRGPPAPSSRPSQPPAGPAAPMDPPRGTAPLAAPPPGPADAAGPACPQSRTASPASSAAPRPPPVHAASPGDALRPSQAAEGSVGVDQAVQCTLLPTPERTSFGGLEGGEPPLREELMALRRDSARLQATVRDMAEERQVLQAQMEALQAELARHRQQWREEQSWATAQQATLCEQVATLQEQLSAAQTERMEALQELELLRRRSDATTPSAILEKETTSIPLAVEDSHSDLEEMESQLDSALSNIRSMLAQRRPY